MTTSARCPRCARVDYIGHIFMCTTNPYKKLCEIVVELYKKYDSNISLEGIVNSDFQGNTEEFYPLGWIFATLIDHIYEDNNNTNTGLASLRAKFQRDKNTINTMIDCSPRIQKLCRYLDYILNN